ncbi:probable G-protein coupled receptor Mth-like 11 [Rhipicephalus sanguineus]|nr:probable G-protein coupled receptor Mth-like 11 [Rhipicephalus sanguineus]
MCMAGTLLVAQVLFLITKCADLEEYVCFAGAVFGHYCFLSTFLWTGVLSFDIWKSLTTVQVPSNSKNTLASYSFLAWGVPLLVVSGAVAVDQTAPDSVLSPNYGDPICFIGSFWGLVVYFFVPMASLVLFCLVLYFNTVWYIRTTSSAAQGADDVPKPGRRDRPKCGQQRTNLALFVRLSLVMGAPWAIALAGSFVPNRITDSVMDVMVGSQGVYLFFIFKDYRYIWAYLRKKVAKTAPSTTSCTSASRST